MAKTIKFNLICDGKPVRTIEDLQNNFSIEDVLGYYDNKLLHRWLEVRGYEKELKLISEINVKKNIDIIKALIAIFNVELDKDKIEENVYIYEYLEERKELYSIYEQENYKVKNIIQDYWEEYVELVSRILANPNDVAQIKAVIKEISEQYRWVFDLNHREVFYTLIERSPLAVMCLLMNSYTRKFYIPIWEKNEEGIVGIDIDKNKDKKEMYDKLCGKIRDNAFLGELGENLHEFCGLTDSYWKDIETKDKKYMIIKIGSGDLVRSSGKLGEDLGFNEVINKFVILDGIDYKSNMAKQPLLYMEV